jgi:hypothetical protein
MHTIVTSELQRQYLQTELILWIRLVSAQEIKNCKLHLTTLQDIRQDNVAQIIIIIIIIIIISGVRLSSLGTVATTGLLYQAQILDDGDCGAIGRIIISRGKSTRRKTAPAPLLPPQISHD